MRTVIYIGLIAIADAINKDWAGEGYIGFYAVILLVVMCMDLMEFISGLFKNDK